MHHIITQIRANTSTGAFASSLTILDGIKIGIGIWLVFAFMSAWIALLAFGLPILAAIKSLV